jgi:hypothetical protein
VNTKLCIVILASSMLSGCYQNIWLHPVQGPVAAPTPPPVLMANLMLGKSSGTMSVVLSDGEVCKGRWARAYVKTPRGANKVYAPTATNLSAEWDALNSPGFYKSVVLNSYFYVQGVIYGNRGTVLHVEMYAQGSDESTFFYPESDVAKDDKGNLYKMNYDAL